MDCVIGNWWHFDVKVHRGRSRRGGGFARSQARRSAPTTRSRRTLCRMVKNATPSVTTDTKVRASGLTPRMMSIGISPGGPASAGPRARPSQFMCSSTRLNTQDPARAKADHPFHVVECQFGAVKSRCRRLRKDSTQLVAGFALTSGWRAVCCWCWMGKSDRKRRMRLNEPENVASEFSNEPTGAHRPQEICRFIPFPSTLVLDVSH